jgi:hypothetical protein
LGLFLNLQLKLTLNSTKVHSNSPNPKNTTQPIKPTKNYKQ